ncbi:MAG: homocysteine S-methyltransferase family protein [Anaerolineaceae bacterium]|nr:homocysteine S-methyltransferase family protein [Anaerolineaceae bacterium]
MNSYRFLERLQSGDILVLDGATGTNLQRRGLPVGVPSDLWVLDNPQAVTQLHEDFRSAGSDILLTNTFGSSRINFQRAGLVDRFEESNRQAVALLRKVVEGSAVLVGGSMGPLGEMLQPYGTLAEEDAFNAYAEQARVLSEAGVDLLVIETQFDLNEAKAAIRGAKSVTDLPLVCSFSYDRGTRSMMGVRPAQMGKELAEMGVAALGINCGRSLEDNFKALQELSQVTGLPLWFKPNAGLPHNDEAGSLVYDVTPEIMAAQVPQWIAAGARLVGGCCGTSPEHLKAIAQAVKEK